MPRDPKNLNQFIRGALKGPAQKEAKAFARALSQDFNASAQAVLYYGSCLRTGAIDGLILDFYVLVDDYKNAHGHFIARLGNALVRPRL